MNRQLTLPVVPRIHPAKSGALTRRVQPGWENTAGCRDAKDPNAWHPHEAAPLADLAEPLGVCARCPVRRSCLAVALHGREHGIWAGTLDPDRRAGLTALAHGALVDAVLDDLLDAAFDRACTDEWSAA